MMTIFVIFVVCLHLPAVYSVDVSYTIMSYNIDCRVCDLHHENGKSWRERFENERDTISRYRPDLIGIQEPVFKLDVRELEMPGYKSLYFNDTTWVPWGAYPDAVIYYKEARFEVLSFDHFWLGPHPDTFPTGFDRLALPRLAIYALLKDKLDGTTFYFGSTHFDHGDNTEGKSVDCYESAKELINITAPLASKYPFIWTGDFNSETANNNAYSVLTNQSAPFYLVDSYFESPLHNVATNVVPAPNYDYNQSIDHIFYAANTRSGVGLYKTSNWTVDMYMYGEPDNQYYASDHWAIVSTILIRQL